MHALLQESIQPTVIYQASDHGTPTNAKNGDCAFLSAGADHSGRSEISLVSQSSGLNSNLQSNS